MFEFAPVCKWHVLMFGFRVKVRKTAKEAGSLVFLLFSRKRLSQRSRPFCGGPPRLANVSID